MNSNWRNKETILHYEIKRQENRGRYMVAKEDLKSGQIIFEEKPLILAPRTIKPNPICIICFYPLPAKKFTCQDCGLLLCDNVCRENFHHKEECQYIKKLIEENIFDFDLVAPLRVILKRKTDLKTYKRIMRMEGNFEFKKTSTDWPRIENIAQRLCKVNKDFFLDDVLKILCILDCNSFQGLTRITMDSICVLYAESSLINHSCISNASTVMTANFEMKLIACENITKGEEITVNYLPPFLTTMQRRRILWKGKCFHCECPRCSDPTDLGTFSSAIRCNSCPKGFVLSLNPLDENSNWQCKSCRMMLDFEMAKKLDLLLEKESARVNRNSPKNIEKFLDTYKKFLHPNHVFLLKLKQWIVESMNENSEINWNKKREYCQNLLEIYSKTQPKLSYIKGIIALELSDSIAHGLDMSQQKNLENFRYNLNIFKEIFRHEDDRGSQASIIQKANLLSRKFNL